ncbi:PAAR domain-containing protein [Erwinia amylovora]
MSQPAARLGDATGHGGALVSGSGNVFINGLAAGAVGLSVAPCALLHGAAPVACGSGSVFINGCPAARLGDVTGCGAPICSGSGDVFIGG